MYAIQNNNNELSKAIGKIFIHDTIVFENAIIRIKLGNKIIKDKLFNVAVISEKSDVLVLVDKYSSVTAEDVYKELDENRIKYHTVLFLEDKLEKEEEKHTPELWFARDTYVVDEACEDTMQKTTNLTYTFDKDKQAELSFEFLTNEKTKTTFTGNVFFSGVIKLEDKIVLITDSHNIEQKHARIESILRNKGFTESKSYNV